MNGANRTILDRTMGPKNSEAVASFASPALRLLADRGTQILGRCQASEFTVELEHFAPLSILHHAIAMVDGIEVLVQKGAGIATVPLLRSLFEATLQLKWLSSGGPTERHRRALAWLACEIHHQRRNADQLDRSTTRGKQLKARIEEGNLSAYVQMPRRADVIKLVQSLETRWAPELDAVRVEIERLCKTRKSKKTPNWFELFDGPTSLAELALELKLGSLYEVAYSDWSDVCHAKGYERCFVPGPGGQTVFGHIRYPSELPHSARMACTLMLQLLIDVLAITAPGEAPMLQDWYQKQVLPKAKQLDKFRFTRPGGTVVGARTAE